MALDLSPIHAALTREFRTSEGDQGFQEDFVAAANDVQDELYTPGDYSTAFPHVTQHTEDIDGLDDQHSVIVKAGIRQHLIEMGRIHRGGDTAYAIARTAWKEAKGDFGVLAVDAQQATRDSDSESPTTDSVGLGYLGDE